MVTSCDTTRLNDIASFGSKTKKKKNKNSVLNLKRGGYGGWGAGPLSPISHPKHLFLFWAISVLNVKPIDSRPFWLSSAVFLYLKRKKKKQTKNEKNTLNKTKKDWHSIICKVV